MILNGQKQLWWRSPVFTDTDLFGFVEIRTFSIILSSARIDSMELYHFVKYYADFAISSFYKSTIKIDDGLDCI